MSRWVWYDEASDFDWDAYLQREKDMAEKMHTPMPVAGYKPQSQTDIDRVNVLKQHEERLLRFIDDNLKASPNVDQRMVALGVTKAQETFMWLARAVFQPKRIRLPEDEPGAGE